MSHNTQEQSRSRQRRGRQYRSRSGQPYSNTNKRNDSDSGPKESAKSSFLDKILAFFGMGTKSSGTPPRAAAMAKPSKSAGSARLTETKPTRQPRPPVTHEVTSGRLYVGNLSYDASESDLFSLFSGVGQVRNAEVVCHKHNQRSKGFAFVEMATTDEAKRAVQELNDQPFMGRKLLVSGARPATAGSDEARAKSQSSSQRATRPQEEKTPAKPAALAPASPSAGEFTAPGATPPVPTVSTDSPPSPGASL